MVGLDTAAVRPANEDGHPVAVHVLYKSIIVRTVIGDNQAREVSSLVDFAKGAPQRPENSMKTILVAEG
jgi:hypothetical protein